jgi:sporulation protein YlmC with PRC-barrel domain
MKKITYVLMGAMVVFSLSFGQAFAQQAPMAQDPMKTAPKAGAAADTKKELTGSHRTSAFMNKNVKNDKGDTLGNVKDFVFDRDGDLSYIIISSTTAPDKLIPIPFAEGMVKFQDNSVMVSNLDKSKLDKAPTFGSAEWNKLDDPTFESRVHGYYREGAAMKGGASGQQDMKKTTPGAGAAGEKKY